MEFPELGDHCYMKSCNRLDFLPMKCDACSNIFCNDHFTYIKHNCVAALNKDAQVPVCPLCNKPVPSKRGEQPDIAVGEHIDRDCQSDPAISKRKIYTNKCNVKGCKQKEVIRINCNICKKSYCLKHRHPADHKCEEQNPPAPTQAAGLAAISRAKTNNPMRFPWQSSGNQSCASNVEKKRTPTTMPEVCVTSVQGKLSEDEALAIALQNSMKETKPRSVQEEEDRLLAQALANSEIERVGPSHNHSNRDKNCSIC